MALLMQMVRGGGMNTSRATVMASGTPAMTDDMKITPGTVIRDNDPRMTGRELEVTCITGLSYCHGKFLQWAICTRYKFPLTRIRIDRIHTDGKPRKSGFSVISYGPQE